MLVQELALSLLNYWAGLANELACLLTSQNKLRYYRCSIHSFHTAATLLKKNTYFAQACMCLTRRTYEAPQSCNILLVWPHSSRHASEVRWHHLAGIGWLSATWCLFTEKDIADGKHAEGRVEKTKQNKSNYQINQICSIEQLSKLKAEICSIYLSCCHLQSFLHLSTQTVCGVSSFWDIYHITWMQILSNRKKSHVAQKSLSQTIIGSVFLLMIISSGNFSELHRALQKSHNTSQIKKLFIIS